MSDSSLPTGILSPEDFNQYSSNWLAVASDPASPELAPSFMASDERILLVRLPIDRMVSLLSAVGVKQVKARFLLLPRSTGAPIFALALYAADAQDKRLSAYYVTEGHATTSPAPPEATGGIPTALADTWLTNWKTVPQITTALFATSYGVLQGYNFKVEEFLAPLMSDPSFENLELQLSFGLSEYYNATGDGELTQTFGLLSRVYSAQQPGGGSGYYDILAPTPPGTA